MTRRNRRWGGLATVGLALLTGMLSAGVSRADFAPSLSVEVTADSKSVNRHDDMGFTIKVINSGDGSATNVTLTDVLPTGTGVAWTKDAEEPDNPEDPNDADDCAIASGTLSCSYPEIEAGKSFGVHIKSPTTKGSEGDYTTTATASADNHPAVSGSDTLTVTCSFRLTAAPDAIVVGNPVALNAECLRGSDGAIAVDEDVEFTVTQPGEAIAMPAGTAATDVYGDATVLYGDDPSEGATFEVINDPDLGQIGGTHLYGEYTATAKGGLLSSASGTFTVTSGPAASIASVTGPTTTCPTVPGHAANPSNQTTVAVDTAPAQSTLMSVRNVTAGGGFAGSTKASAADGIEYQIIYSNNGAAPATDVSVEDTLASGQTYVAGSCTGGTACSLTPAGPLDAGDKVTWQLGTVAAGSSVTLTFQVDLGSSFPANTTITNVAVSKSADHADNSSNQTTVVGSTALAPATVTLVRNVTTGGLFAGSTVATAGNRLEYQITYTNNGTPSSKRVSVSDSIASGLTYVDASCGGAACSEADGTVSWLLSTVAGNGGSVALSFQVDVDSGLPEETTSLTNSATSATLATPSCIAPGANVTLTATGIKDAAGNAVADGTVVAFTITPPTGSPWTQNGTVSGITAAEDTASVSVTVPGFLYNLGLGASTVTATAGTGSKACIPNDPSGVANDTVPYCYTTDGTVPATNFTIAAPNITVGNENIVTVSGLPSGTTSVVLQVARPSGNPVTKSLSPIVGDSATFTLTRTELQYVGTYTMAAGASPARGGPLGVAAGSFSAAAGTIGISASDVDLGNDASIVATTVPANAATLDLTVTKPGGGQIVVSFAPPGDTEGTTIASSDLDEAGVYNVLAVAEDPNGGTLATGTGSFRVRSVATASAPDINLGQPNTVSLSNLPAGTDGVSVTIQKPSGATVTKSQAASGTTADVAFLASQLNEAGAQMVSAKALSLSGTTWIGSASTVFIVSGYTLAVSANPEAVTLPNQDVSLTALYEFAGAPVSGALINFKVTNSLGQYVQGNGGSNGNNGTTNASGIASLILRGSNSQTLAPGTYTVTVKALATGIIATTTFTVVASA